jgi:hypothetical protein
MKSYLLAAAAALTFTACSRTSNPSGSEPYPVPPGQPVPGDPRNPVPGGGESRYPAPYPSGDNTTTYPQEGQRDGVVTIIRTGSNNPEGLPPGQAKKKYGGKSAKVYAPGQQKKNGGAGIATVISVPDQYASRATSGQLFYVYRNNTYWKQNDGYYHLATNSKEKVKGDDDDDKKVKEKKNGKGKGKKKG